MKEPTREQIKEAFKETIERWEKIVEDVDYFNKSECMLCQLGERRRKGCEPCPIKEYNKDGCCKNTPYWPFEKKQTPENALAELNFLRKVYIWWMEGDDKDKKQEKKEEWVDVAKELTAQVYERTDGFAVNIYHNDLNVAFIDGDGIYIRAESEAYGKYKASVQDEAFRILKKT